jgi:hypothetical protein
MVAPGRREGPPEPSIADTAGGFDKTPQREMKRAALSPNALTLPSCFSTHLEIVRGRQRVIRKGIFFTRVGKHLRSVYMQFDGEVILADECICRVDLEEDFFPSECCSFSFVVTRDAGCPIDEHKVLAVRTMQESEDERDRTAKATILPAEHHRQDSGARR